ncbi:MAG: hypothetical protein AB1846_16820 [Chloroflexota bacterium]
MRLKPGLWAALALSVILSACGPTPPTPAPRAVPATEARPTATEIPSTPTQAPGPAPLSTGAAPSPVPSPTAESLPLTIGLDPAAWMGWPVIPVVTQNVREIYARGLSLGNDPTAFSILGDCQSTPDTFLGLYVVDAEEYAALPPDLQETVDFFGSSFNRESPTAKSGTTSGALLWAEWHEGKFGCGAGETPLDCELRLRQPSFALITVGTHWEARNEMYMRKIIERLLDQGVVPILSTKADNREGDHRLNLETAMLADEYNLPLWNFWPVTDDLPNRGLYTKKGDEHLGDIYLTEEALARHRLSALEALNAVWRAATGR